MKLRNTAQARSLAKNNAETLGIWASKKFADTPYYNAIRLIAEVLDAAAAGQNGWITIGTTKSKGAFTFTVNLDDDSDTEYGAELASLCRALNRFQDDGRGV